MNRTALTILVGILLVLGVVNGAIFRTENRIATGRTVYLELAPVDPRSLMQGDYMILNYAINRDKQLRQSLAGERSRGHLILQLDDRQVGSFSRIDDGAPLAENETRLRYRHRHWRVTTAPQSFFFQEGHAARYEEAKYGILRVSHDGVGILVGLADKDLATIGDAPE